MNIGLAAAVQVLGQDASGLTRYLEEQAADNPLLRLTPVERAATDWLPRWRRAFARDGGSDAFCERIATAPSLIAHVEAGIETRLPPGRDRRIAEALAAALEPTGWLGRPLAAVAAETGAATAEVEAVLRRLQDIGPAGLFARNLMECLGLQALDMGWLDPVMAVLLGHLDLVADGAVARLARLAEVEPEAVEIRLRRLRSLNPKPGLAFEEGAAPLREPDLLVRRDGAAWVVELNRSALPEVTVAALPRGTRDPALREKAQAARHLAAQVAARGRTILRVGQEVLQRQMQVLEWGPGALVPLTMQEVAEALELHVSTVSRAVAGTAVDTPQGTWWLRRFFTRDVGGDAPVAAGALRARLAQIVAAEDPARPHSDATLALLLDPVGAVARRTVAKYRAMLGIPPAHRRRRRPG